MAGWVAAIADNVQNPIAGIGAALDVLERHLPAAALDDPVAREALAKIRTRLGTLSAYVTELASFADPAAPTAMRFELQSALIAAIGAAREHAQRGAHITFDVEPGLGAVHADGPALQTMVKALLINALEAVAPDREPVVRLAVSHDGQGLAVVIEDNGPGFAPEALDRAFEAFFTTKEAGTGLGLAVVKKHATAAGGTVELSRSPALGGALVILRLPGVPT